MIKRGALLFVTLIALLAACGGGDDDDADTGDSSSSTTSTTDGGDDETTSSSTDDGGSSEELPQFASDFDRVCNTQVGFEGATEYDASAPGPHPVVYMENFRDEGNYIVSSRTLPAGWAVTEDANFEDNSDIAIVELIACSDRVDETPNGTDCEFDDDGDVTTLELVDTVWEITVYEATTGEALDTVSVEAASSECPFIATYEAGDTQYFNSPSDDDITNALKASVDP